MEDNLQMAMLILLMAGIFICLIIIGISKLFSIVLETSGNEYGDIVEDKFPEEIEKLIGKEKKESITKVENTEFEITNMKGSEVITEVVYAD